MTEDQLVNQYQGLVANIVGRFRPANEEEREDMVQVGNIGLLRAIRKFEEGRGSLVGFAHQQIQFYIRKYLEKQKKHFYTTGLSDAICSYLFTERKEEFWEYLPNMNKQEQVVVEAYFEGEDISQFDNAYKTYARVMNRVKESNGY